MNTVFTLENLAPVFCFWKHICKIWHCKVHGMYCFGFCLLLCVLPRLQLETEKLNSLWWLWCWQYLLCYQIAVDFITLKETQKLSKQPPKDFHITALSPVQSFYESMHLFFRFFRFVFVFSYSESRTFPVSSYANLSPPSVSISSYFILNSLHIHLILSWTHAFSALSCCLVLPLLDTYTLFIKQFRYLFSQHFFFFNPLELYAVCSTV